MLNKKLSGSFVALITPFNKDGSVDFAAFRSLLKFQEDHGTAAVLVMGSTGETSMLSPEEKNKIIVETAKMKTTKMPIFFGCTANMTGNIAPTELAAMSTPWSSYVEAENFKVTYLRLLPLLHFTYSAINPVAVKSLMKALGMPSGDLRKPLTGLDADALAKGLRIVADLELHKTYGYKLKPISAVAA